MKRKNLVVSLLLCMILLLSTCRVGEASSSIGYGFSESGINNCVWTGKIWCKVFYNGVLIGTDVTYVGHGNVGSSLKQKVIMYQSAMQGYNGKLPSGNPIFGYAKELKIYDTVSYRGGDSILSYSPTSCAPSSSYSVGSSINQSGVSLSATVTGIKKDALKITSYSSIANDIYDIRFTYKHSGKAAMEYAYNESIQRGELFFEKGNTWGGQACYQQLRITASFNYAYLGPSANPATIKGPNATTYVAVFY